MREKGREPGRIRGSCGVGGIVAAGELRFVQVDHDEQRLRRQELKAAQPLQVVAVEVECSQRLSVFERRLARDDDVTFALEIRRFRFLQIFLEALQPPFGHSEVGKNQLVFHRLRIARRIDGP